MSLDLPKSYDAKLVEPEVYQRWEKAGCFKAGAGKRGKTPYTIAIPPPNVTGVLHMGHALNNTLQDTLIRWRRMQGHDTLWQPGTDHAGIATESVVAKQIQENQAFVDELKAASISAENPPDAAASKTPTGYDRDRFGRTAFLKAVWHWKAKSGGAITHQLRKLGSSCDWSRERFTMDEGLTKAVRTMFVKLSDAGLIYRGTRMVNWCPVQKTALSDDEVEASEKNGHLWQLKYELVDGSGHIVVETTRPETFFGDTAVAVNPADPRYQAMIGKQVRLPIIGREIPIVGDEHADPEKGSGAVKITPAHDPNDYEVGKRHNLPLIRVIDFDGTMTKECAHFAGMDRFVCRKALLKELEASGVLLGATEIVHSVGHSYRSGVPIEPMVTEQWFVKMGPLAERAVKETQENRLHFHPERWGKVYEHWLVNVRDWCISRQIWWGHRIPAWHCAACQKTTVAIDAPTACKHCGSAKITQDPDVLDTWFSSALWPYSTLGWPDWEAAAKHYFPTSTLVTDRGIIFFWVARMVMTSLFANDVRPFDDVYIHGTVLDERGDKMSKSKGNGIDPIVMIEGGSQIYLKKQYDCPGYGADAVRYTLLDMTTEGQDLKLSPSKFETGRNFANKVWNAGRFVLMNLGERTLPTAPTPESLATLPLGFPERWILDRLQGAIDDCTGALTAWRFNDYANGAYRFFRDDLCDWYLEWAKRAFKTGGAAADTAAQVLSYCFDRVLRLLHPGMPFVTEYLWQLQQPTVGGTAWSGKYLMTEAWPEAISTLRVSDASTRMGELQAIVTAVRNVRNLVSLADGVALQAMVVTTEGAKVETLTRDSDFILDRANLFELMIRENVEKPPGAVTTVVGALKVHIPLSGLVDLGKLKDQLSKRAIAVEKSISGKQGRLGNADYIARAPAQQVTETREMLAKEEIELTNLKDTLAGL
ncbi:MAG: valine--tRNA ligase [Planctomycetes bacterium]|nr:valine--tRNA ligase [Planctomycetota bacterium]